MLPNAGPGLTATVAGRNADEIAHAAAAGDIAAIYLLHTDPLLDQPRSQVWDAALEQASTVIAHARFLTPGIREHATVVFPGESHAE